jgi:hypothetical protein
MPNTARINGKAIMKSLISRRGSRDVCLDLIREFPMWPTRSDAKADGASRILEQVFVRENLDDGTSDYIHALAKLLADYQDRRHPVDTSDIQPVEVLRHLMSKMTCRLLTLGGCSTAAAWLR